MLNPANYPWAAQNAAQECHRKETAALARTWAGVLWNLFSGDHRHCRHCLAV